ncbi:receptor-like protein EIX1 [Zingiber officinale]|uniref:receptor-like protein EIX1 n=1 Tax=Zingiber officinale TaxID=94328 RepID=UPI001C4B22CE|nr:receptor-like protein EIX1 [Zingiber officinale]
MATTWRSTLRRFPEPMPVLHHPHLCYYLRFVWLISLAFLLMEVAGVEGRVSSEGCLQRERDALLLFKAAIKDPSARLSSWRAQGDDCCAWTGVVCHNRTGSVRVAELNLGNPNVDQSNWKEYSLRGELLHPSLLSLSHLQRLNLSFNDFEATQIPPLVGSLHKLMYLDLYHSNIGGTFPPHLGNLTNLRSLFLGLNSAKVVHSLDWFSGLSSLIYLDMSALDLSAVSHNWFSAVNMLPSLQSIDLSNNCLTDEIPKELGYLVGLQNLNLSRNYFRGKIPDNIGGMSSMETLDLSFNNLTGVAFPLGINFKH